MNSFLGDANRPKLEAAQRRLVERLLADGWERAGAGDAWYAERFRRPHRG